MLLEIESSIIYSLDQLGFPFLLLLLFLKGLLIGKPIPLSLILPAYLVLAGITGWNIVLVVIATAAATTTGQYMIFVKCKQMGYDILTPIPFLEKDSPKVAKAETLFKTHGNLAIFGSGFIPGLRGLLIFPAATAKHSTLQFLVATYTATFLYHLLISTAFIKLVQSIF